MQPWSPNGIGIPIALAFLLLLLLGCEGPAGNGVVESRQLAEHSIAADNGAAALIGVDHELAAALKAELVRVLEGNSKGKLACTPPMSAANQITDFVVEDDGGDGVNMSWTYRCVGDYDQNGEVNVADLTPIGLNFGANSASENWDSAKLADGDGNGEINVADVTPIGVHFGEYVSGYKVYSSMNEADYPGSPDDPNGTGAFESGEYDFSEGTITSGSQREFEINLESHDAGTYYWVRPFDARGKLGAVSNIAAVNLTNPPWTHTWGLDMSDQIFDVAANPAGDIFAVGMTSKLDGVSNVASMLLLIYSADGELLCTKVWGLEGRSATGKAIAVNESGDLIIFGHARTNFEEHMQLFIQKRSPDGTLLWNYVFDAPQDETAEDMLLVGSDVYCAGRTESFSSTSDIVLLKLDGDGNTQWARRWKGAGDSYSPRIAYRSTSQGDTVYLTCTTSDADNNLVLLRYSSEGSFVDQHTLSAPGVDVTPVGIQVFHNSFTLLTSVYITARWFDGAEQIMLTAVDGSFNQIFLMTWYATGSVKPTGLMLDDDFEITVVGWGSGIGTTTSIGYLCRFDRELGSIISAMYYELAGEQIHFNGVASIADGILVWGDAENNLGRWSPVSISGSSQNKAWVAATGVSQELELDSVHAWGLHEEPDGAVQDTGGGARDALVVFRPLPK